MLRPAATRDQQMVNMQTTTERLRVVIPTCRQMCKYSAASLNQTNPRKRTVMRKAARYFHDEWLQQCSDTPLVQNDSALLPVLLSLCNLCVLCVSGVNKIANKDSPPRHRAHRVRTEKSCQMLGEILLDSLSCENKIKLKNNSRGNPWQKWELFCSFAVFVS